MNTNKSKITSTIFKILTAVLLSVSLFTGSFTFALAAVPIEAVRQDYLVKLSGADAGLLETLGSNVQAQFVFSGNPEFQNIYKFSSPDSLDYIKSKLGNKAAYVQIDRPFFTSSVLGNSDLTNSNPSRAVTVNDPGFTSNPLNIDRQWALPKAGFDYAWSKTTGSTSNIVAIIDTGIDATHEDLQSLNLIPGYNFFSNQVIVGRVNSDDNGHGTLVAGILGATANNGIGIVGTNWVISVMPLKALDTDGKGDSSSVAQAIVWAADHGANLINLSLGGIGFGHDTVLSDAISYAFNKGALIVAAAGNDKATDGNNLDTQPVYPVCDDNDSNMVLGVAATDQNDLKASFSDFGQNCIDVSAPGKRILSTINHDPLTKTYAPNSYAYVSGTSVAVPFVVGQAALLKALNPNATNAQIRDQILSTADPIDNLNLSQCGGSSCRGLLGAGRINVRASVDQKIQALSLTDGDLVSAGLGQPVYQIVGGQKRMVSAFVLQQKFPTRAVKTATPAQLQNFPDGAFVTPLDNTLVKSVSSPAVYMILNGQKLPVLYKVFLQRKLGFSQVSVLDNAQVDSWITGNFLPPQEGTLVRTAGSLAVYWVVGGVLHPINYNFYTQRGLNVFPIFYVSSSELASFAKGEAFIR
jgi:subtilisin family serine protease